MGKTTNKRPYQFKEAMHKKDNVYSIDPSPKQLLNDVKKAKQSGVSLIVCLSISDAKVDIIRKRRGTQVGSFCAYRPAYVRDDGKHIPVFNIVPKFNQEEACEKWLRWFKEDTARKVMTYTDDELYAMKNRQIREIYALRSPDFRTRANMREMIHIDRARVIKAQLKKATR